MSETNDDKIPRPAGCVCSHEEGDSDCPVHVLCSECGEDISHQAVVKDRERLRADRDRLAAELERLRTENNGFRADVRADKRDAEHYQEEAERLRAMGEKINAIRDSIVGLQAVSFSAHIYPLVAALNEAGFESRGYDVMRAESITLIEQRDAAIRERDEAVATTEAMAALRDDWHRVADERSAEIVRLMRERDEARDLVLNARVDKMGAEVATAERIAAWLDAKSLEHGKHGHGLIEYLALHLRAGAWRGQNGGV